ncbi:hypothetical protein [Streptomyces sp. NPDC008121]|uniref:hypothetical protein n=1 Tax=Streptomyces sp. NPDC008121 TaxID=3364809 RepID=UPI0036EE92CA
MIRSFARSLVPPLAAASLLLTACSGGDGGTRPAAAPARHAVFDQPLDRQVFLALRQTQKAGTAAFTQTVTFASAKAKATQTLTGRLDFAANKGEATVKWNVGKGFPQAAREAVLGTTPSEGEADAGGEILTDPARIHYRPDSSLYWLRYASWDRDPNYGTGVIDHLRGSEAPIGGTLLEGLGAAEATAQRAAGAGRTYQATMRSTLTWKLFPPDLMRELSAQSPPMVSYAKSDPVPVTVTVDARGRVTHVRADFSWALGKKDSAFQDMKSLRIDLALTGHGAGASRPAVTPGSPPRDASTVLRRFSRVKAGDCVDFNTGQRTPRLVVTVPCAGDHDGRVFAQKSLRPRTFPGAGAAKRLAVDTCRDAYSEAPDAWTEDSGSWSRWPQKEEWNRDGGGHATCYTVT